MIEPPIVATQGSPLSDPRLVEVALSAIWPGPLEEHVRERAANFLGRFPALDLTYFRQALLEFLANNPDLTEARPLFQRHADQTLRISTAYRPESKPNWKSVFWPNPSVPQGRPLYGELAYATRKPIITRSTAISSAGSCFATEIKKYLISNGYNYIETEANEYASANWGMQYNTVSFRQMIEWVFELRERPSLVWETNDNGFKQFADAFRERVYYDRLEDYVPSVLKHRAAARAAIERTEVFVLTMGLIEIWRLASSDDALARYPREMDCSLVRNQVLTVADNVAALKGALSILLDCNPKLHLIVTVSPVPLYATFQGDDRHVVEATQHAKSVLNVAVHEFADAYPENVTYFPAFETVMWLTKNPWEADFRHVSAEAVGNVMRLFEKMLLVT